MARGTTARYLRRYLRSILRVATVKSFFALFGSLAAVVSLWAVFDPDLFKGFALGLPVALAVTLGVVIIASAPRTPRQSFEFNSTVNVVVGDIFVQGDASYAVGMCTTFDTDDAGGIISSRSLQGQFLERAYNGDRGRLDADLDHALRDEPPVGTIAKLGKQSQYAMGTVACLQQPNGTAFYCMAYTEMSANNVARGTIDGLIAAINNLWEVADARGNGRTLCLPVLGQGLARVPALSAEMSVRLIILLFVLRSRRGRVVEELRIVVRPQDEDSIDFRELSRFLKLMRSA